MSKDELVALLRLQHTPHIGDKTAKKLIAHCGSPAAVFSGEKDYLKKIDGIGPMTIRGIYDAEHKEAAEAEYEYIDRNGIEALCFTDAAYPVYLKHCPDGPILLFKKGNIDLEGRKVLSVVGTRNITAYGMDFCDRFIADLAPLDPVIVSGFAYGVDIRIQKAAIKQGLQTISCLAHGLNQLYPGNHRKYAPAIIKNGGFLTEFWSTSNPDRENFLKRNRIIAGMSEATVVIESAERGGSLVTADIANSYNRDVFAVPGRADDPFSLGCNNLIKQQKAHMLTSAADLVYMLNWDVATEQRAPVQKQLFITMDDTERLIYTYLEQEGKQLLDSIAMACQIPVFRASSALLNMELKGIVRPLPGKAFEAI